MERHHHDPLVITNTGYLVQQRPGTRVHWQAYPKNTTMNVFPGEIAIGTVDEEIIKKTVKSKHMGTVMENWHALASITPKFPRICVNGKDIELRVCADAAQASYYNLTPARSKAMPAHAILVPAIRLNPEEPRYFSHLKDNLHRRGFMVISDQSESGYKLISRKEALADQLPKRHFKALKKSNFIIDYR